MKQIIWIGDSYKAVLRFSAAVKRAVGYQLHLLQQGSDPDDWKPMQSIGPGVREIRIKIEGQYRIIYLAKLEKGVYVLHAFNKKTQKTSKKDIDIATTRYRELMNRKKP